MANDPAGAGDFSDLEEEFFRAGEAVSAAAPVETWADLEPAPEPASVWSRMFKRTPRAATEPPPAPRPRRAATEPDVDEWDWQIAIARARHATHPGL